MAVKTGKIAVYDPQINKNGNVAVTASKEYENTQTQCVWMETGDKIEITAHDFEFYGELPADGLPGGRFVLVRKTN